jgi:hypothetical protein
MMTQTFRDYLLNTHNIQLDDKLHALISTLYDKANIISGEPLDDIFVANTIDGEGRQIYTSLLFFSSGFILESKNLMAQLTNPLHENIDIIPLQKNIRYTEFSPVKYDFIAPVADSRLVMRVDFSWGGGFLLSAAGKNCENLLKIYKKYFKTNISAD